MQRRTRSQRFSVAAVTAASALVFGTLVAAPHAQAADVTHTIAQVQGTNVATSPSAGTSVTVEGVITGDHRTGGFRGLYVQTPGPADTDSQRVRRHLRLRRRTPRTRRSTSATW